jgi:glycosyltransferase involved in cell wall biosynthesis
MKIVYLLPGGLFNSGGMERVVSIKANYLVDQLGYDVSIVTTEQMGRPVFYPLSDKVHLHHLDIGIHENFGKESYLEKVISRFRKTQEYKHALEKLLINIRPDITISTLGGLDIGFINKLKDGSVKIGELHFPGNYRQLMARKLSGAFIPNFVAKIRTRQFKHECEKLSRLIVLTEEEKSSWKNQQNIVVIPNPLPFYSEEESALTAPRAIAVGRLAYEKGFDMLIEAWKAVAQKHPDWTLDIFGNGVEKENLQQQIIKNNLEEQLKIHKPESNILAQYLQHSIMLFSSRYLDALPMVLIEAQSVGLPIVSFDSPCGPKDIITNGSDGFLIKTGDVQMMTDKICQLIENPELRLSMGKTAKISSQKYREERIMNRWMDLFKALEK